MNFQNEKRNALKKSDLSKKAAIDSYIESMVNDINRSDHFYTTSSCSGRIIVLSKCAFNTKKQCQWLFVTHETVADASLVLKALENHGDNAVLLFEPFILHVCCDSLQMSQSLLHTALESGFRNSGITISKRNRIMVAVRSTHSLQVPLSLDGKLLVSNEYIEFVINQANEQLKENFNKIDKFYTNLNNFLSIK